MYVSVLDYVCAHYEGILNNTLVIHVRAGFKVVCAGLMPCPAYMYDTSPVLLPVYIGTVNIMLDCLISCQDSDCCVYSVA